MTQRHYDCHRGPSELARMLQLDTIPTVTVERASTMFDLLSAHAEVGRGKDAAGPETDSDPTPAHGIPRLEA